MLEFTNNAAAMQRWDFDDKRRWGIWLYYITSSRKVWVSLERILFMSVYVDKIHETLDPLSNGSRYYSCPYMILHISLRVVNNKIMLKDAKCLQCRFQVKFLKEFTYFKGHTYATLLFMLNGIDTSNRHLVQAVISHPGGGWFGAELYCDHITLQKLYLFYPPDTVDPCLDPRAISFRIMAEFWNLTLKLGGAVAKKFDNAYPDVCLDQVVSMDWTEYNHFPEFIQLILWDYFEFAFSYCMQNNKFKVDSIINILFRPFDLGTWICILCRLCLYLCGIGILTSRWISSTCDQR